MLLASPFYLNLRYKQTFFQLDNHCFPYKNLQKSWVFHIYVTLEAPETSHISSSSAHLLELLPLFSGPFHEVKNLSIINMSEETDNIDII